MGPGFKPTYKKKVNDGFLLVGPGSGEKGKPQLMKRDSIARKTISFSSKYMRIKSPVSRMPENNERKLRRRESSIKKTTTPLPVLFSYLACQFLQDEGKLETIDESSNVASESQVGDLE